MDLIAIDFRQVIGQRHDVTGMQSHCALGTIIELGAANLFETLDLAARKASTLEQAVDHTIDRVSNHAKRTESTFQAVPDPAELFIDDLKQT